MVWRLERLNMGDNFSEFDDKRNNEKSSEIIYNSEKDFYKGIRGEYRLKAEGLFKKAKEKGISIEEVNVLTLKENRMEFPGLGIVELPTYFVKVKGRNLETDQIMVDGKLIDYNNRLQKYIAESLENKNVIKDERGKKIFEGKKFKIREDADFSINDWEMFEIGRSLIDDKEFGIEKTITGACDRIIRKLMGENDWVFPEEARLLDEEFNNVQKKITSEQKSKIQLFGVPKKATDRQVNYFKARVKNSGLDPENESIINEILRIAGFGSKDFNELSTTDLSKLIDSINSVIPRVKDELTKKDIASPIVQEGIKGEDSGFKQ